MISTPPFFHTPTQELFRPHGCCTSVCTNDFLIRQPTHTNFSIRQLVQMTFAIRQLVHTNFSIRRLVHEFCNPSARTHDISDPSTRTHRSCDLPRVVFSTVFTVCASTKYTQPFLINRLLSITKHQEKSQRLVHTNDNLHPRSASSRSPHGNHTVSSDRKFSTRSVAVHISGAVFHWHF